MNHQSDVWPPPHPSPPLPPPREYGSPGTAPSRHPWLVGLLAAVAVAALVGAALVVKSLGDDEEPETERAATPRHSSTPTEQPATTAPTPAAVRCWDGSPAQTISQCSRPDGAAGMTWVFPTLAAQKCGTPTQTGPGVVLRVLCVDRLADGSRVQVGYYQWQSVRDGIAFYEGQGLTRADGGGFLRWTGGTAGAAKSAALYAHAPFSVTVTLPGGARPGPEDDRIFALRPPDQLRGEPAA